MFNEETVFILGAGASWHYGYPTGEELIKEALRKGILLKDYFQKSMNSLEPGQIRNEEVSQYVLEKCSELPDAWNNAYKEAKEFVRKIQEIDTLVIDHFLWHNPSLGNIGKLIIAMVLLERHTLSQRSTGNINRKDISERKEINDNWYRFIIHKLLLNCHSSKNLCENSVTFITFNYDTSLEYALEKGLKAVERLTLEDITEFLSPPPPIKPRIIHVYGKISKTSHIDFTATEALDNFQIAQMGYGINISEIQERYNKAKKIIDAAYRASKSLRLIAQDEKNQNTDEILAAKAAIRKAKNVCILGYGFDEYNNSLLDLYDSLYHKEGKSILFTNFGDYNRINKKASWIFGKENKMFLAGKESIFGNKTANLSSYYCEKSTRNVYDALMYDFDLV
ncbi:MAG TPA: SIR2 family protein [Rickettsiales bacterium]|nr:SIR2 family protein [Rickettsiales bacterium]